VLLQGWQRPFGSTLAPADSTRFPLLLSVYMSYKTAMTAAGDSVLQVGTVAAIWDALAVVGAFGVLALGQGGMGYLFE
jgi:hypothetical protein